jgi:catechol 2,3-dioxygenase-like lactoylglutathione lyase family enzyme
MMFTRLHHMQIAMPRGAEPQARAFYVDVLGMTEVPKPEPMRAGGGAWFRAGGVELHLGADEAFVPNRKGHPGILVEDLDDVIDHLERADWPLRHDDRFPGYRRIYADDPFGNRMEFLQEL